MMKTNNRFMKLVRGHIRTHATSLFCGLALITATFACAVAASAQSVVQPGAPGQPTKEVAASVRPQLQQTSAKDVEFMQMMIVHHAQAVEMVALFDSRTENRDLVLLGARIAQSQTDEMNFMKRWLVIRGESIEYSPPKAAEMDMSSHAHGSGPNDHMLMPGMLTAKQMDALRAASGKEFDKLFLKGMIQHHRGALAMVKDLFGSPGAGQDSEVFNFATDVDSGQRAEIARMEQLLDKIN